MSDTGRERREATLPLASAGDRVDQAAAALWPEFSRSRLTAWLRSGALTLDGAVVKPNRKVIGGERLVLDAEVEDHPSNPRPQPIDVAVLYEDDHLLVVDKPAGQVVHPGSGNPDGTLVNALLHHEPALARLPRAGLVHRLDKDTSGCLLVARTGAAHAALVAQLKRRDIHRHYQCLVWGELIAGGTVDAPLGRHPVDRRRQVVRPDGRRAVTHYRLNRRLAGSTWLDVKLETGRTHQIRVHMQHLGFPLVGDPMYGRRGAPAGLSPEQRAAWQGFPRQALHAARLVFDHPLAELEVDARSPLPGDLVDLLEALA
ncbi:RluA family pseudouridine synthase [Wenzhouxiangella sp. XN79A]|uniref:RluA family pseudouridine synthase n=1 Tax=Wenzhouxiangella sp. XN79A TaxID=2724193 RepID=UPI003216341D